MAAMDRANNGDAGLPYCSTRTRARKGSSDPRFDDGDPRARIAHEGADLFRRSGLINRERDRATVSAARSTM